MQLAALAPASTAHVLLDTYAADFAALGAKAEVDRGRVVLDFATDHAARVADGVLRDTIDGVRLIVRSSAAPDARPVTFDDLLASTRQLPGVNAVELRSDLGFVEVWAAKYARIGPLERLLSRDFMGYGVYLNLGRPMHAQ